MLPTLDDIARRDLVWSYVQHDWSSIRGDPSMSLTEGLLRGAQERGVEIVHYADYYERRRVAQEAALLQPV